MSGTASGFIFSGTQQGSGTPGTMPTARTMLWMVAWLEGRVTWKEPMSAKSTRRFFLEQPPPTPPPCAAVAAAAAAVPPHCRRRALRMLDLDLSARYPSALQLALLAAVPVGPVDVDVGQLVVVDGPGRRRRLPSHSAVDPGERGASVPPPTSSSAKGSYLWRLAATLLGSARARSSAYSNRYGAPPTATDSASSGCLRWCIGAPKSNSSDRRI
ncbi:hypothetical protein CRUP_035025 [Coryphaenoides rupestris]|nr:hypothetical protein CRUP_035025 [Coryphaenoides rupestris]